MEHAGYCKVLSCTKSQPKWSWEGAARPRAACSLTRLTFAAEAKQYLASIVGGRLQVCKHGAVTLTAALDPTMGAREMKQAKLREHHQLKQQALLAAERRTTRCRASAGASNTV
jgi:hypothetical protein